MPALPEKSIDLILCDLSYGTTKCAWDVKIPLEALWQQYDRICKENAAVLLFRQEPFSSLLRISNLKAYKYDWYWEKERLTNIAQIKKRAGKTIETISVFYRKQPVYHPQMSVYTGPHRSNKGRNGKLEDLIDWRGKPVKEYSDTGLRYPTQLLKFQRDCLTYNLHPTQKPVALLKHPIRTYTDEGDIVLDNCMGSGSTGIACLNTNRSFIDIELDTYWFKTAEQRINQRT